MKANICSLELSLITASLPLNTTADAGHATVPQKKFKNILSLVDSDDEL